MAPETNIVPKTEVPSTNTDAIDSLKKTSATDGQLNDGLDAVKSTRTSRAASSRKTGVDFGSDRQARAMGRQAYIFVNGWVGMSKTFFDTSPNLSSGPFCEKVLLISDQCDASSSAISYGAEMWVNPSRILPALPLPQGFKLGGGLSYLKLGSASAKFKGRISGVGIINLDQSLSIAHIPLLAQIRYDVSAFYFGGGGGVALNVSSYQSNGTFTSDSFSKSSGLAFMGFAGVLVPMGKNLSLDFFARVYYLTGSVSNAAFDPVNTSSSQLSGGASGDAVTVIPGFAISFYL